MNSLTRRTEKIATRTAEALEPLRAARILDNLLDVLGHSFCSLNEGSEVPIQAYANCGGEYGVELTFAHTLKKKYDGFATQTKSLHIRKAAEGGKLVTDFLPGGSEHDRLLSVIDGADDAAAYRAFVWYQGENNVFEETSTQSYYDGLNELIDLVTERMYRHGKTSEVFPSSEDIPILVFKLGFWPQNGASRDAIDLAHEQVVANLINNGRSAALIEGGDQYSRFFHLDAPTLLILGSKLADEYVRIVSKEQNDPNGEPGDPGEGDSCSFFCLLGRLFEWIISVIFG